MARYIDSDRLLRVLEKNFGHTGGADVLAQLINAQPTADVVEVKHGKWNGKPLAGRCTVRCSICGSAFSGNDGRWKYCPNCGADMRGASK